MLTSAVSHLSLSLANLSTGDFDTCAWTLGDGFSGGECTNPSHTYSTSGEYSVVLTVSGLGGGDTETKAMYITVYQEYSIYLPLVLHSD